MKVREGLPTRLNVGEADTSSDWLIVSDSGLIVIVPKVGVSETFDKVADFVNLEIVRDVLSVPVNLLKLKDSSSEADLVLLNSSVLERLCVPCVKENVAENVSESETVVDKVKVGVPECVGGGVMV